MNRKFDFSKVNNAAQCAIEDFAFPGGVYAVGNSKGLIGIKAFGHHTYKETRPYMEDDIFDLASLTKVCAAVPAAIKLYDEKRFDLDQKVADLLPQILSNNKFQNELKSKLTIRQLLNHSSGFPPDNDIYKTSNFSLEEKWRALYKTPLAYFPGAKVIYSDVNMLLLQKIIEAISGIALDKFLKSKIYDEMNMHSTMFNPSPEFSKRLVPTEYSICDDAPLMGIVHDENSRTLGGVTGHAGLFSTAQDLANYAMFYLNCGKFGKKKIVSKGTIKIFTSRDSSIPGSNRSLGWNTAYDPSYIIPRKFRDEECLIWRTNELYEEINQPSAGLYIDPEAIGHTGFTGTSIWISFKHDVFVILLTNRVFISRNYTHIDVFNYRRQKINSLIWEGLGYTEKNEIKELTKPNIYHKADYR